MKIVKLFILMLCLFISCTEEQSELMYQDEITLSSEFVGGDNYYYRLGFSFEESKYFAIPVTKEGEVPDLFLYSILIPGTDNMAAFLYTEISNKNGIFKNADFNQLSEAESYYNNYNTVVNDQWKTLSDTLEKFQVYTFKTIADNYVKLLILDVRVLSNFGGLDYMEIDLRYFIQRDGSQTFIE